MTTTVPSTLVQRLWNYCNLLRDDGMSYGDYVEQLTYLLFLKMDHENSTMLGKPSTMPAEFSWAGLLRLNDVKTDYPIPLAFIVAPKERRSMFDIRIVRRTFAQSELGEVCQFMDYEQAEALLRSHKTIVDILP